MKKTDLYLKPGTFINASTTQGEVQGISLEKFVVGVLNNPTCCPKPVSITDGMLMTAAFLDTTLQTVTDQGLNASPLLLSTTSVTNKGGGSLSNNAAFGEDALVANTTGNYNVAVGKEALLYNTTGSQNTAIGNYALGGNETGINNTAVGSSALSSNYTGSQNTAVGRLALGFGGDGNQNTAVGEQASLFNTTGSYNTAMGNQSLYNNFTGSNNVAIGWKSLSATTASNNTAVGYQAGEANVSGTNNTLVGKDTVTGNFSGSVILGVGATANANNQFVVGSTTVNAGAVDTAAVSPTKRWKVKINGVDYYIALQPA
jgi:trimeric autotransporter adhesin